jgi:TolB-like protein/Tfp pilus assembly protein PilF
MSATRRLAAILVADVVGYSRLIEADEAGTLAALKARRKAILEPVVKAHGGRIVKVMGDGVLIEFASAVNAVKAALQLQAKFAAANEDLPDDHRVLLRIGINLGDIIGEGSDIYGEGVNIAARLEALADPGGICISAKVHDEVRGKTETKFEDMGEHRFKNITLPVRVFATRPGAPVAAAVAPIAGKPSVAVLPFTNMSGDPEQQYFSDGITEDIITELSRCRSLFVIARNSTFQYRDKAVDIRRVARELGVGYVVEGSVRRMGERIRITAQLIDAAQGNHLWSERYDREIRDVFAVQDEVTRTIVATLIGRVEEAELGASRRRPTASMEAYDSLLRGIEHLRGYGADDNPLAREHFERAIALDPRFARAHAYFALALLSEHEVENAPETIKMRALDAALLGVRLDARDSLCHVALADAYLALANFDVCLTHCERAASLNPNDANNLAEWGYALAAVGRAQEGNELIRQAMRLNPFHPDWYWGNLTRVLHDARRYEEALEAGSRFPGKKFWHLAYMAACCARLGRLDRARALAADLLRMRPDFTLSAQEHYYKNAADAERLRDGLRMAGLPE